MKPRMFRFLLPVAAAATLIAGCATDKKSFNQEFHENFPGEPKYVIDNVDDDHFKVTVYQGSPTPGAPAQRVIYMKQAANAVTDVEAKRRGWQRWHLYYLNEHDQGWMHIIVGKATREK
jgi:hypothetical protein